MEEQKIIHAENIKGAGIIILYLITGVVLAYLLAVISIKLLHTPIVALIGLIVFGVLPLFTYIIFNKKTLQHYEKKATLIFYDDYFQIKLLNFESDIVEDMHDYYYNNILSCSINSSQRRRSFNRINLTLKDNTKLTYNFRSLESDSYENIPESIFTIIKQKQPTIQLARPFLLSRNGHWAITIMG